MSKTLQALSIIRSEIARNGSMPKQKHIADAMGCDRSTVKDTIERLVIHGHLHRRPHPNPTRTRKFTYELARTPLGASREWGLATRRRRHAERPLKTMQ